MKKLCLNCSTPLKKRVSKFCSSACQGEKRRADRQKRDEELFKQGKLTRAASIKRILLSKGKRRCSICKRVTWNGEPIPLWLDHKDGNAANSDPKNFRLICLNCDAQQPTFGAKNYGKGRKAQGLLVWQSSKLP